jgi:hypothetical protein
VEGDPQFPTAATAAPGDLAEPHRASVADLSEQLVLDRYRPSSRHPILHLHAPERTCIPEGQPDPLTVGG